MTPSVGARIATEIGSRTRETQPQSAAQASALSQKDVFLKLLVAQVRNQNPLEPTDGMAFVSQLSQFSQLEAMLGIREDLRTLMQSMVEVPPASDGSGARE